LNYLDLSMAFHWTISIDIIDRFYLFQSIQNIMKQFLQIMVFHRSIKRKAKINYES
jgi:hypothetical protein